MKTEIMNETWDGLPRSSDGDGLVSPFCGGD
jgi:hypothetical protein